MRCLDHLGANVRDPGRRQRRRVDGRRRFDRSSSGSRCRGWGRRTARSAIRRVHFAYAVNPFMVGNLADTPFDGQTAILQRGRRGRRRATTSATARSCPATTSAVNRAYAGAKPQFLALAPWVVSVTARARRCARSARPRDWARRLPVTCRRRVIADLPVPRGPRAGPDAWWPAGERRLAREPWSSAGASSPPRGDAGRAAAALAVDAARRVGRGRAGAAMRRVDVVVIGAGLAGLTAASDLATPATRSSCSRHATASAAGR